MERLGKNPKYLFFSFLRPDYSRTGVYLNSSSADYAELEFVQIDAGFIRSFKHVWETLKTNKGQIDVFVVNSPSHLIAVMLRIITRKPVVLDAGWPLSDGIRSDSGHLLPRIRTYLIDLISFHSANLVILESDEQIHSVSEKFLIKKSKLRKIFTGFDENSYDEEPSLIPELKSMDTSLPTILFRGSWNPESGLRTIEAASKQLEKKINLIICTNAKKNEFQFSKSTFFISRRLTNQEVRMLYENSDVVLGQISTKRRLAKTIPHKAFEAGFFSKPYISGDNQGLRELYPNTEQVEYLIECSPDSLSKSILNLINDEPKRRNLGARIKERYSEIASQEILGKEFFHLLSEQIRS